MVVDIYRSILFEERASELESGRCKNVLVTKLGLVTRLGRLSSLSRFWRLFIFPRRKFNQEAGRWVAGVLDPSPSSRI